MNDQQKRKLVCRLHRLEGQVGALEKLLENQDPLIVTGQFEAVIAAAQSTLAEYWEIVLSEPITPETRQKLIKRIARR